MDNLSKYLDQTLLKITSTKADFVNLCTEAIKYNFYSVCVPPYFVPLVSTKLKDSSVKVCSVVGFPSGLNTLKTKIFETKQMLSNGAHEIDFVANISLIKNSRWDELLTEILAIKMACGTNVLKVIIESSLLSKDEILNCCLVLKKTEADFIKTSTGFNGPGAKIGDVVYMSQILRGSKVKIKASGGIRDLNTALSFINAGCARLGTSSGVKIINQLKKGHTDETTSRSNY